MAAPRKENVKQIILSTTEKLLETQALSGLSLADIAKAAKISKGTLYYHYKNKNEILFDLTDQYLDQQWHDLVTWSEDESKDTSLHRLIMYVAQRDVTTMSIRMNLYHDAMLGNEEIRKKLVDRYCEFAKLIADKISERTQSIDANYLAWLVLMAGDGMYIQQILKNNAIDPDLYMRQTADVIKRLL